MSAALRPYVTAGVALVGASVISVTPLAVPQPGIRSSEMAVSLSAASAAYCPPGGAGSVCGGADVAGSATPFVAAAAAGPSIFNIPANLFNAIASIPANEIMALDRLADAMFLTGSWQVWSPTNTFGFDVADPPKLKAFIDLLVPFPALSTVLGEQLSVWAEANLPMNAGCAALPGACPHPEEILAAMFRVPFSDLYAGTFTFPDVVNPFDGSTVPWANTTPVLDPFGSLTSFTDFLLAPPTGIQTVSFEQVVTTLTKFTKSMFESFYPFVQNSEWFNPEQTGLAGIFQALAPILCSSCDPDKPYDNPFLHEHYDPHYYDDPFSPRQSVSLAALGLPGDDVVGSELESGDAQQEKLGLTGSVEEKKKTADTEQESLDPPKTGLPAEDVVKSTDEIKDDPTKVVPSADKGDGEDGTDLNGSPATPPKKTPHVGRHRTPDGGLNNFQKSVHDTISKFTGGSKSGTTKPHVSDKDGAKTTGGETAKHDEAGPSKADK